jgi:pimeloyl-ACP methyl ester carboxylesterase
MDYVSVNGIRLAYAQQGHQANNEPVLLLIHGLGATHLDWEYQVDAFASHYRVIRPDLRGFGESDRVPDYTVDTFAEDLIALLDSLKIQQIDVIGHSMGGAVALQMHILRPQLIRKLVISNSLPSFVANSLPKKLLFWSRRVMVGWLGLAKMTKRMAHQAYPQENQRPVRERLIERSKHVDSRVYAETLKQLTGWSVADRLHLFTLPTLWCMGEKDFFPQHDLETVVALLPKAQMEVFPETQHQLPLEAPQSFNSRVLEFLRPDHFSDGKPIDPALRWLKPESTKVLFDIRTLPQPGTIVASPPKSSKK